MGEERREKLTQYILTMLQLRSLNMKHHMLPVIHGDTQYPLYPLPKFHTSTTLLNTKVLQWKIPQIQTIQHLFTHLSSVSALTTLANKFHAKLLLVRSLASKNMNLFKNLDCTNITWTKRK